MASIDKRTDQTIEWYRARIEFLSQFMLAERVEVLRKVVGLRTRYITVCMENAFHPHNASALIRNCEAFGLQDIHTVELLCHFRPNKQIVRGTDKWIDLYRHNSTMEAVTSLKNKGYRIVATTPHKGDVTPELFDVTKGKFCLVMGTEKDGISDEIIEVADEYLKIPMYGFVESLNVSASAAILLHELSGKLRSSRIDWRLSEQEQMQLLFEWSVGSVKNAEKILKKFEL